MSIQQDPNPSKDTRHITRLLVVQYLFSKAKANQLEIEDSKFTSFDPQAILNGILEEKKFNRKLYEKIVDGVEESLVEIDETITKYAPEWPLDQVNTVDLSILRAAIWEGFIGKITPTKVVINEAIELSKELSSEESSGFINGVLGNILKNSDDGK